MAKPNPTPERQGIAAQFGMRNVPAIAQASIATGLPFWLTLALIEQESGGLNVYGHDEGGVNTVKGNLEVTPENFLMFFNKVVLHGQKSNGVGPAQITYAGSVHPQTGMRNGGYFRLMFSQGLKPWEPVDNITFGAQTFKVFWEAARRDVALAATRYNAGASATTVNKYGLEVQQRGLRWRARFGIR